eukprot:TRINITY_DN25425_c0_g1_i1.p1 TRINITY_DN25425_c0_g1~~TRINITY_DN25425_c0_g1_i1.p1  ORF type:complete len:183 (+),score=30.17 TRINITY_DN25425_c0_g1_i1:22-570(+)
MTLAFWIGLVGLCLCSAESAPNPGDWSFVTCTFTSPNGTVFDFSTIAKKTITWNHLVTDTGGHDISSASDVTTSLYNFELALCAPVITSFSSCTDKFSAVNVIDGQKKCTSVGDYRVGSFAVVPYNDGVVLRYYFGDAVSHTAQNSAHLYLICGPDQPWYFEHITTPNEWHFKLITPLACWH